MLFDGIGVFVLLRRIRLVTQVNEPAHDRHSDQDHHRPQCQSDPEPPDRPIQPSMHHQQDPGGNGKLQIQQEIEQKTKPKASVSTNLFLHTQFPLFCSD